MEIITDWVLFVWQVLFVSSFHSYCISQYTFEESRINTNQYPLFYNLIILIAFCFCHLFFFSSCFRKFVIVIIFSCLSLLCFLRQEPYLVCFSLSHYCLVQFFAHGIFSIILNRWVSFHFIREWITEKSKCVLKSN